MYGLSKEQDLTYLVGKEVTQVCVGKYQSVLHLSADISIHLECRFKVSKMNALGVEVPFCSPNESLLGLLGCRIANVINKGDGELALGFTDGSTLVLFDSKSNYESYQILNSTHRIIV